MANRKLGNVRNLGNLGIFFASFLLPSFRFSALGQSRKVGREKVGKKFPRFPSFRTGRFYLDLCGIHILKVTYMSYIGKVFESLTNKIQSFQRFKNFQCFRVFILSSIEPKWKDGNDGKFRKPHFSDKLMNGVVFKCV